MKKDVFLSFFLFVINFTCSFGQTQFFVKGSIQSRSKSIYQIGMPVDIPLDSQFVFSTGLFYAHNKISRSYNSEVIRTEGSSSTGFGGIFGCYHSEYFNAKTFVINYLSIPLIIRHQSKADKISSSRFFIEAGVAVVYTLKGKVSNYEVSNSRRCNDVGSSSEPSFISFDYLTFEKADLKKEGINPFNLEGHLGFGLRLPRNFQISAHFEFSLLDSYGNSNGFRQLVNQNAYVSLNVPIHKIN